MTVESQRAQPLVLVVDDSASVRILARATLEQAGFAVQEAENGGQALAAFEESRPDLVLLDVMMPEMDGFATCTELRKLDGAQTIPVVLLTALDDVDSIHRAYDIGATDFINKPLNEVVLAHRIRYILRANRALQDLSKSEARLAHAQRLARVGNWDWDIALNRVIGSEEFHRIMGLPPGNAVTLESFLQRIDSVDREFVRNCIDAALSGGEPVDTKHRLASPDGQVRIVHLQAETTLGSNGSPVKLTGTVQDISELKRFEKRVHFLAYYDTLTHLPNRVLFKDRLTQSLSYAQRHKRNLVTMFLDIDRFKRINDTLGHNAGDMLLRVAADRLKHTLRASDSLGRPETASRTMARLGGDEFIISLNNVNYVQNAARVAQRILEVLSRPIKLNKQEVVTTASIGISVFPTDGEDIDTLLKNADTAMYHAKNQGGNNYQFYSTAMNEAALERLALENELRKALKKGDFLLYFQPKVDLRSGEITGVEVLVRWRHREMGVVSPAVFLQIAEEAGLLGALDEWVMREGCKQLRVWQAEGQTVSIAVNVSNSLFQRRDFIRTVKKILGETGLPAGRLELELTEGIVMKNAEQAIKKLNTLKKLGLKLSIDDFGTEYSSLSYLRRFPIDTLKIDRTFISELPGNEDDASITRAIIALAHNLKKNVIAEGVETPEQMAFLQEHDCDQVQGYLFSPPVNVADMTEMLKEEKSLDVSSVIPSSESVS